MTLSAFIRQHQRVTVLSGAGVSTASGIADYRDANGNWKHARPMQFADFITSATSRKRYWARSYAAWPRFHDAEPNNAHRALAGIESLGLVDTLITQNVDDLHRRAGSERIIDLHGRLCRVRCLECHNISSRHSIQKRLEDLNSGWNSSITAYAPDGDAHLRQRDFNDFRIADCTDCGGVVKPDVVFFGESVPLQKVEKAYASIKRSRALIVVGSSLMVFSGFRFARSAASRDIPIAILNRGITRADDLATLKIDANCEDVLLDVSSQLATH